MSQKFYVRSYTFNKSFFDLKDPVHGLGIPLPPFSFAQIYEINEDSEALQSIQDVLNKHVHDKLVKGDLGKDIKCKVVNFIDSQHDREHGRRYVVFSRETIRGTKITILARFLTYGSNKLYIAFDSYILDSLNIWDLSWRMLVTFVPLFFIMLFSRIVAAFTSDEFLSLICGIVPIIIFGGAWIGFCFFLLWIDTYRNYQREKNIFVAIKQAHNKIENTRSFNMDDILMTLKSVMPLVTHSVRDVLKENGLSVKSLDAFNESIQNVSHIQNVYGSYNAIVGEGQINVESISKPETAQSKPEAVESVN